MVNENVIVEKTLGICVFESLGLLRPSQYYIPNPQPLQLHQIRNSRIGWEAVCPAPRLSRGQRRMAATTRRRKFTVTLARSLGVQRFCEWGDSVTWVILLILPYHFKYISTFFGGPVECWLGWICFYFCSQPTPSPHRAEHEQCSSVEAVGELSTWMSRGEKTGRSEQS